MVQALRRKMFKLGGEVSKSHGVGITSGLSYNKGGRVGLANGGMSYLEALEEALEKGAFGKKGKVAGKGIEFGRKIGRYLDPRRLFERTGPLRSPIKYTMGDPSKVSKYFVPRNAARIFRGAETAGLYGTPFAVYSTLAGRMTPEERAEATDFRKALDTGLGVAEVGTDFAFPIATVGGIAADTLYESMQEDPNYFEALTLPDMARKMMGTLPEESAPGPLVSGTAGEVMYTSPQDIADKIAELNRQRLEEDIEMYRSVIPEKEVNPLQMLGTPLIEGGAALLSGEGYGAAARAFNDPLEAARLSDEEREAAIASGAAEFALGNYATERGLEDATIAELIKTGDLATAEQVQKYTLANKLAGGFVQTLPESPKEPGILDVDNLSPATVYQNPKSLKRDEETPIGGLFVAVNKNGTEMKGFDSIEEATAYAQSG